MIFYKDCKQCGVIMVLITVSYRSWKNRVNLATCWRMHSDDTRRQHWMDESVWNRRQFRFKVAGDLVWDANRKMFEQMRRQGRACIYNIWNNL